MAGLGSLPKVLDIDKNEVDLSRYEGKVSDPTLSEVGLARSHIPFQHGNSCRSYKQLVGLKEKFGDDLQILAFPCNQFGAQEPGSNEEIKSFASSYGANFKLFDKVNGDSASPLYEWLRKSTDGTDIRWNFEKFLIGKDGKVAKRAGPKRTPEALQEDIQSLL